MEQIKNNIQEIEVEIEHSSDHNTSNHIQQSQNNNNIINKDDIGDKANANNSSSITTVFAVVNCMVGSVILLLPINFGFTGIILSLVIMGIVGFVSCNTCKWVIKNSNPNEQKMGQVIERLLGHKWLKFFSFVSFIAMFSVGIVIFLLINSSFYQVATFVTKKMGVEIAASDSIDFSQYSMQWQSILLMIVFIPFFFFKSIQVFINLSKYGAISIYCYLLFILYIFSENLIEGRLGDGDYEIKLYTFDMKDISFMIGNFATAYIIHHEITQLMSTNKNKKNKIRDVGYSYGSVSFILGSIGVLGALALVGRKPVVDNPIMIYDYFEGENAISFLVAFLFFTQQFTVLPWFNFTSRVHFFELMYESGQEAPRKYLIAYNIVYAGFSLLCQIFLVDPNYIIGIVGAVIGFVMVYLIPIQIRDQGYYQSANQQEDKDHKDTEQHNEIHSHHCIEDDHLAVKSNNNNGNKIKLELKKKSSENKMIQNQQINDSNNNNAIHNCVNDNNNDTRMSSSIKYALYFMGFILMVVQLVLLFTQS